MISVQHLHALLRAAGRRAGLTNRRQRHSLNTRTRIPNKDNNLPIPLILVPKRHNTVSNNIDDPVWQERDQAEFRLTDTSVSLRGAHGDPIAEGPGCGKTDEAADEDGEV